MPAAVKALDHLLELAERLATARSGGIGGVGGEEGDRVVAPVVQEALPREGVHAIAVGLLERPHRHELDRVDAERLEVGNLLDEPGERAGPGDAGGRMLGEAAHVQFIDDRLDGTDAGRLVVAPVEGVVDDQAASGAAPAARGNAPACATRQRLGVRIQELLPGIEALQVRCRIGDPIHTVRILDAGFEPLQEGVPDLTRPMEAAVEGNFHHAPARPGGRSAA